ncbi:alpha-(1,3)-fucosyltransferase 4-like [Amphiprion ocellaris]|uniref:alpha-(1,3)-fucosyltransferase 4-like n=1 Tax=Amphiprion ocellaris TaxID=80972 RepID=UPI000C317971|nr:alpha-(1,3)-fucosyltransferase 4-like [Amphiprion ocellaris]
MGVGAHWRPAARSRVAAHRAEWRAGFSRRHCWERLLRRIHSSLWEAILGFLFLLWVCFIYLPDPFASPPEEDPVTLLIWTHPFGEYRELPDCWELYQIDGCTLTDDERAYPEADAVIIHHREIATLNVDLPPEPRPHAQKWIWLNYESPSHTPRLWLFEGIFNLTMSYRTDSDIFLPYGYLVPRERALTGTRSRFTHPLRGPAHSDFRRPRLVAWVVSNWSESHARVSLFHKLRRFVHVDVFGRVGRSLPKGSDSVVQLLRRYLFYLALENSLHTDYITEKLWNAVLAGAVPVVLGPPRKSYERFLPPEAFIHVDDFTTVQDLARYLLMLRSKPALMRRHLDWRGRYSVHRPVFWGEHFCTACKAVRKSKDRTDVVKDLTLWFHS